jgi:hypothetical protein
MQQEIISYCPQCLLVVFAAMGFYQYVMRDRILNGSDPVEDEYLEMEIGEMDEATQLMLLEILTNDHLSNRPDNIQPPGNIDRHSA